METAFNYGVETISDVLKAQEEEFKSLRDLSKAKYSYIKNRVRFLHAVGMISEENLVEINGWLTTGGDGSVTNLTRKPWNPHQKP